MDIIDNLRYKWRYGSMLIKLVFVNIAVFIILNVATLILSISGQPAQLALGLVEMPSQLSALAVRPWTVFTYMFSQYDFLHLLFNMVWLYWFGSIFLLADSSKNMCALYIYGGLGGAALFIAGYAAMDTYGLLIGSSASVLAIVTATAIRQPDYKVGLLFLGEISLKWLAIITIAIDLLSMGGNNGGGHMAHIGGAITGAIYAIAQRKGVNIAAPFNSMTDSVVNLWKRMTAPRQPKANSRQSGGTSYRTGTATGASEKAKTSSKADETSLDEILDKVKKSGYGALSAEEKKRLFDISRRIK